MKPSILIMLFLLLPIPSCNSIDETHGFYFLDHQEESRIMLLRENGEIDDITPGEINGYINDGSMSPSGRYIAVHNLDGIFVISTQTMDTKKVLDFGGSPHWSSDEKWLYFAYQKPRILGNTDPVEDRVFSVNLESGNVYVADRLAENGASIPSWLPTSSSLLFTSNTRENVSYSYSPDSPTQTGIYQYDVLTQKGHFLLQSDQMNFESPYISPDGQMILYQQRKHDEFFNTLVLSHIGSDFSEYKIVAKNDQHAGIPLWSPDSKYFWLKTWVTVGFLDEEVTTAIYDRTGNIYHKIEMSEWNVNQVVWGESSNDLYIARIRPVLEAKASQIVKYNIKDRTTEILFVAHDINEYFLEH